MTSIQFQSMIRIPKATFTKKMKGRSLFAGTHGQSIVGILELINRAEELFSAQEGAAKFRKFDLEKWVGQWLTAPQPVLGGVAPAALMDTPSGRQSVMRLLGSIQSGAYQ